MGARGNMWWAIMSRSMGPRLKSRSAFLSAAFVPIVEEVVVQQRAPNQRPLVEAQPQPPGQLQAQKRHGQRVLQHADFSVLHVPALQPRAGGSEYVRPVAAQEGEVIRHGWSLLDRYFRQQYSITGRFCKLLRYPFMGVNYL